jgi:predicted ATPase
LLTKLHATNFKSLGAATEPLTLCPITILVGANSSGKSSLIQSLLLIKQTFQYGGPDRPVLLNGPLLRLGNFYDVKNALSPTRSIRLGFGVTFKKPPQSSERFTRTFSIGRTPEISGVLCDITLGLDTSKSADELALLQPFLRRSVTTIYFRESDKTDQRTVWVNRARRNSENIWTAINDRTKLYQLTDLRPRYLSDEFKAELSENRPNARIHGAYASYMVPTNFLVSFDEAKQQADLAADLIIDPYSTLLASARSGTIKDELAVPIKAEVCDWLSDSGHSGPILDEVRNADGISEISAAIQSLTSVIVTRPSSSASVKTRGILGFGQVNRQASHDGKILQDRIRRRVVKELGQDPGLDVVAPQLLDRGSKDLKDYFTQRVKYLGPLRESPKPLYPLEALSDPTDVGYRGEHTAAVLDLNKRTQILYVPPPRGGRSANNTVRSSLQEAVVDWLVHMDMVSDVETGDRGKFGRELQVEMPDVPKLHDLTNVGVGVSQVLPIIVMALLAPEDSTIILEQPELHLHPKVQSRLGDFLLSLAALDKQCIVETHSEHLIYRLRRRVAEDESDLGSSIGLYFVERSHGETITKRVEINRFGSLSQWPKGFFDQAQLEAEQIIKAAAEKHKRI